MLEKYEQTLENWIASNLANGDDDAVFASGYLQGHVAVVLSQLEADGDESYSALEAKMQPCIELAKEELEESDFALVEQAWSELSKLLNA